MTTQPVLTFSTLSPERPKISIDGKLYELSLVEDFGLVEQSRIARLMKEATDLENELRDLPPIPSTGNAQADEAIAALGAVPEQAAERVLVLLDEILAMILRAPADVRAALRPDQKRQVVEAFMPAVTAAAPTEKKRRQTRTRSRSTSGSSRRTSRPRTATGPG